MRRTIVIALTFSVCFAVGLGAEYVWSRMRIQSISPLLTAQGAAVGITTAYVTDTVNRDVCVLVIRDDRTGSLAAVTVPRLSCDVHGSAQ